MGIVPQSAPGVNADGLVDPEAAKAEKERAEAAAEDRGEAEAEADSDSEFDDEAAISMSAMAAALTDGVSETRDDDDGALGQFRKLQEKRIDLRLKGRSLPAAQAEAYEGAQNTIIEELKKLKLNNARIESLVEQLYAINRKLIQLE